jgi:uncharacterized protein YsxB (DUF464 family)
MTNVKVHSSSGAIVSIIADGHAGGPSALSGEGIQVCAAESVLYQTLMVILTKAGHTVIAVPGKFAWTWDKGSMDSDLQSKLEFVLQAFRELAENYPECLSLSESND